MTSKKRDVGYEAIADELRARIESGELPPGAKVPGEKELMAQHGVSRDTAWKALQVLRDEGLTHTSQGAPTKVRKFERIRRPANQRLSREVWGAGRSMWSADIVDKEPTLLDLRVERVDADERVAAMLGVPQGTPIWRRRRRYAVEGKPVLKATSYIPADIADGTEIAAEDTGRGGVYARLEELGHGPTLFREEVRSRMPNKEEKEQLDIARGTPVIEIHRFAAEESGRIVEVNEMVLDSASYVLEYVIPA
ncbi:GntR family transcriptional regulator [Streptomyces sp. NPDC051578]|uniref:GntR family transcriptional regulator n=1 Tax=Streptomyces sp. NPDC051578 TaxID=3365662 RepID=UPI00378E3B60